MLPVLQAWYFGIECFCSGAVDPVMARPRHPCRLSCSRIGDREKPSLLPRPRPPAKTPTVPAVGCSLSVVRLVVLLPASSSTVNTNTQ
ncbi:hypothetical protein B0T18DRAFT_87666 [Schizothecium vesticola]|uniref:Uncharacterized protein n=1 Tax=Schizothecium vesticola TaxID=314040 RepID=A0AA40KAQ4_9PEZI|nr:hypothetical protein B0T18DRAFT_87666 [Schizothecium vesticola]